MWAFKGERQGEGGKGSKRIVRYRANLFDGLVKAEKYRRKMLQYSPIYSDRGHEKASK